MSIKNPLDMSGKNSYARFRLIYDEDGSLRNKYVTSMIGYWNDTNQYVLSFCVPYDTDDVGVERAIQEMNQAVPLMKKVRFALFGYHDNEDNSKQVIFEEGVWKIEVMTYGVKKVIMSFGSILEMVKHIRSEATKEE